MYDTCPPKIKATHTHSLSIDQWSSDYEYLWKPCD